MFNSNSNLSPDDFQVELKMFIPKLNYSCMNPLYDFIAVKMPSSVNPQGLNSKQHLHMYCLSNNPKLPIDTDLANERCKNSNFPIHPPSGMKEN